VRVLLTHDALTQGRGGVSRYVAELARELQSVDVDVQVFAGLHSNELARATSSIRGVRAPAFRGRGRINRITEAMVRAWGRFDLVHFTMPDRRPPRPGPRVVTIYDVITLEVPEEFPHAPRRNQRLRQWVEAADLVLTPTEATRHRLCELLAADPDRVRVTPFGVRTAPTGVERRADARSFFLYVGERRGYKNFDVLLRALALTPGDTRLCCVGGGPWTADESRTARALGVDRRLDRVTAVDDPELDRLYGQARALVSTSRYEGFGLPVLEAMAHGCPVICSRIPPHQEVAGRAADYFDPGSVDELASLLGDAPRDTGRKAGPARAREFTWERTAAATVDAYRSVVPVQ
jgi:glycosyltransferase involved in cell wall biosynthesis